jgi:hypothetical protein
MHLLYLDPGTGAILAQAIAAIAGGFILFKNTLKYYFNSIFKKKNGTED